MTVRCLSTLLFTFFISISFAQPNSYDRGWKNIDSLVNKKGLTRSALKEINTLYQLAKKEKNDAQLIKSLVYRTMLASQIQENENFTGIIELENEIKTARQPAKAILQSILAENYYQYFQQLRWKLYDRSRTVNFVKEDINTWGASDFHTMITKLHLQSITPVEVLKVTRIGQFNPIIIKGNVRHLRPTLYDLLAHRALDYFKNDERDIARPAFTFEIRDTAAFAPASIFVQHHFVTRDTGSLQLRALSLFQQLLVFHRNDADPAALLDVDIERIDYVYQHAVAENKETLYLAALNRLISQYGFNVGSQAAYLLARYYAGKAERYNTPADTTNRYLYIKAHHVAEKIVQSTTSGEGKINADALLKEILQKELRLEAEKVNVTGKPFRMLVTFRNIPVVFTRLIAISSPEAFRQDRWSDDYWKRMVEQKVIRQDKQTLPLAGDFQRHRVEIKVDELPPGEYALLASSMENFQLENNPLAIQYFHVSNLAYINNKNDYYIRDRVSGKPLGNVTVNVWLQQYDSRQEKQILVKGKSIVSDPHGFFIMPPPANYAAQLLELVTENDRLFLDEALSVYRPENPPLEEDINRQTFLFTDRSLFRPGQVVFFKGIVVKKKKRDVNSEIEPNLQTTVFLFDMNGRKIDSAMVTTNAYGSYSGMFNLPEQLLNGQFRLQDNVTKGTAWFNVEEYKRPTFQVAFNKPPGIYRLNDSIPVTGLVNAFAGYTVGNADVKYRVVRNTILPLWTGGYNMRIWPPYGRQQVEIGHGETTTSSDGSFRVVFKALPDHTVERKSQPVFQYTVYADVTDINGETRSTTTSVSVAYQSLQLSIQAPEKIHTDSTIEIKIYSRNLNEVYNKSTVVLKVYQLSMPSRILRSRYWEAPDTMVMNKQDYVSFFPDDIYMNEEDMSTWERTSITTVTDTTSINGKFILPKRNWQPGWYLLQASIIDGIDTILAKSYINLYNSTNLSNPIAFTEILTNADNIQPGQLLPYSICTNLGAVYLMNQVVTSGTAMERKDLVASKGCNDYAIPVSGFGDIHLSTAFVKNNRFYMSQKMLDVTDMTKQLKISFNTYRDKTLPGAKEKWSVKITGGKSDKVAAELLTTMYDASLDEINPHKWSIPTTTAQRYYGISNWSAPGFHAQQGEQRFFDNSPPPVFIKTYDQLFSPRTSIEGYQSKVITMRGQVTAVGAPSVARNASEGVGDMAKEEATAQSAAGTTDTVKPMAYSRKNFNESAFFFPTLQTDSNGNVQFSFTMPEALTSWKWMALAHNKMLSFGYAEKTIITQKLLMVQPNAPRFFREGDRLDFTAKLVNLSDKEMTGQVELQLLDPATNQPVDGWFRNMFPNQYFTVGAGLSIPVSFTIEVPFQYGKPVTYRIIARTDSISDGEENTLPVISNQLLITESMPLPINGSSSKHFTFEKLLNSNNSERLHHHALTVEFTANPAWYAVQALPYMMQQTSDCSEQVFNKFYASALASGIAHATPKLQQVFERWKIKDTTALISALQKNEALKTVLLQETPWVMEAYSETQQKRNIALLFDLVKISAELNASLKQLKELQSPSGAFVWFKGGPDDRYMTQYIVTGFGKLAKLNALPPEVKKSFEALLKPAMVYLDKTLKADYDQLIKKKTNLTANNLGYLQVHYLYLRSLFLNIPVTGDVFKAYSYYRKQAQQFWITQNRYGQGMIALSLHRTGDVYGAQQIVTSLKQNAIVNEEMGMYWKDMSGGYYWYQAPVETQALLIEAFQEITADKRSIMALKTWLLKNKQTNRWHTTKATADACYALLLDGPSLLENTPEIEIRLGTLPIRSADESAEAGTGYFRKALPGSSVKPAMGDIQVFIKGSVKPVPETQPAWGAIYWQYFEDIDKITAASTPLKITRQLFIQKNTDTGPVLEPVYNSALIRKGDKIKVRIELRVDRAMEYVHMKDARAAAFEPLNDLSGYKFQGGLGYYQSTSTASTNFFFHSLPKGVYVFEYALYATQTGTFTNGICTIQSMYAPEFNSHTESVKVNVE